MWFDLDFFGTRKKQLRELNAAIMLAHGLSKSLSPADADSPGTVPGTDPFMAAVQIRSLLEFVDKDLQDALRQAGSPFKFAFEQTPQWIDNKALAHALIALQDLLESRRVRLLEPVRKDDGPGSGDAGARGKTGKAKSEKPGSSAPADEASVLWGVTEKLYASWQVRAIALVVGLAIVIATGGSFLIGGQTLNVRQDLDKAQDKAQTEIKAISEATQNRVSKESESLFGRLHERGADLEKAQDRAQTEIKAISETTQSRISKESESLLALLHERGADITAQLQKAEREVVDLKAGSDKIKTDIIKKLQEDLKTEESSLRNEILYPLAKIRDNDLSNISSTLASFRKTIAEMSLDAEAHNNKLAALGPKLDQLRSFADHSDKIGKELSTIAIDQDAAHNGRTNAETEANTAMLQRKAAELSAGEAEKQRDRVINVVKNASDEAQKHNRTLAIIEHQLNDLDGKLKASDAKLTVSDAKLNGEIAAEEIHLKSLKERINALDSQITNLPPKQPLAPIVQPLTSPVPITESDLSPDDRKQIQRSLAAEGLQVEKIDGKFGKHTIAAIRAHQAKIKAEATGHLTPEQIETLRKR
jgi:peptidoglycan hydrolase-like protein with peptidoglycan-binding domain